jgi:hypothetical protein
MHAVSAVCAHIKFISALNLHMAFSVSSKPDFDAGNTLIKQLQINAFCEVSAFLNGYISGANAVKPKPCQ